MLHKATVLFPIGQQIMERAAAALTARSADTVSIGRKNDLLDKLARSMLKIYIDHPADSLRGCPVVVDKSTSRATCVGVDEFRPLAAHYIHSMANSSDRLRPMWAEDLTKVGDLYARFKDIFKFVVHSRASAKINDITGAVLAFFAETEKTDTTEQATKDLVSELKDTMEVTRASGVDLRLVEEITGKETMPPEVVT
jgi:hypothetical protein